MTEQRRVIVENTPTRVVTVMPTVARVINIDTSRVLVATVADTQRRVLVNDTTRRQIVLTPPDPKRVVVTTPQVRIISIGTQGPAGPGGSGNGLVYSVQDGPDYQASYVYVGYKAPSGEWYIYRRTYAGNVREYADGNSGYSTAWTNRIAQVYS